MNPNEFGTLVAESFASSTRPREVSVTTAGMTNADVLAVIDAIFNACAAKSITLKGVAVDAFNYPLPHDAEYVNATHRNNRLIIADINLDNELRVRRA